MLAAYLVMVGGDEPQLQVQVVVPLLHADELEHIFVLHAAHAVDLILVLPGELILCVEGREKMQALASLLCSLLTFLGLVQMSDT